MSLALALGIPLASAAGPADETFHPLNSAELSKLVSHGAKFRALPPGSTNSERRLEFFYADGRYAGCSDIAFIEGAYSVTNDHLCIDANGAKRCRLVLRSASGEFAQRAIKADGTVLGPTLMSVSSANPIEGCLNHGGW